MVLSRDKSFLRYRAGFEEALPDFLAKQRWFGGKARQIQSTEIIEVVSLPGCASPAYIVFVLVKYTEGQRETYALPVLSVQENWENLPKTSERPAPMLRAQGEEGEVVFCDALWDRAFALYLLNMVESGLEIPGQAGSIVSLRTSVFQRLRGPSGSSLNPALMRAEQSNTSIAYGDRLILKFFRRLEEGTNPDLEIGTFLTEKASFAHIPPMAGAIEFRRPAAQPITLAFAQGFVANQGDAWKHTLRALQDYFGRIPEQASQPDDRLAAGLTLLEISRTPPPARVREQLGAYMDDARLLGQRTAELHLALASNTEDLDFAPEPFSQGFQEALSEAMQNLAKRVLQLLGNRLSDIPVETRQSARAVLEREAEIRDRFRSVADRKISAMRTRLHGDYHLGQVLFTGSDFVIIDFEGEPARSLSERRAKRSPLQDVAGMLRSFHYAAYTGFRQEASGGRLGSDRVGVLEAWAQFWYEWTSACFLNSYLVAAGRTPFIPQSDQELSLLLNAFLLEKAVYELGYELNNRPDWVRLPLQGILDLLGQDT